MDEPDVAVIGGGPAGLMAAEAAAEAGLSVTVFDRMPSLGRKFLMAGRGGLNLTHVEPLETFLERYGDARPRVEPLVRALPPEAVRAWADALGADTFTGSSGRVFPRALKASPLLRAWLRRLQAQGVRVQTRATWMGWDAEGALRFETDGATTIVRPKATVLALGGASWPRLGSDGRWVPWLEARGVETAPFRPANCGFDIAWTPVFRERSAGTPVKGVAWRFDGRIVRGEAVVTAYGLEGGAVYALSAALRNAIAARGSAGLYVDLKPDLTEAEVARRLAGGAAKASLSTRLRKALHLAPVLAGLLREGAGFDGAAQPATLARRIKGLRLTLVAPRSIDRAISSAGGVAWRGVSPELELEALPGVWVAGEMLDWEAPTGGHLLTACFASGRAAGLAIAARLTPGPTPRWAGGR